MKTLLDPVYAHIFNGGVHLEIKKEMWDREENEPNSEYPSISLSLDIFGNESKTSFYLDVEGLRFFAYHYLAFAHVNYENYDNCCEAKCDPPSKEMLNERLFLLEKEIEYTKELIKNYNEPENKKLTTNVELDGILHILNKDHYKKLLFDMLAAFIDEKNDHISVEKFLYTLKDKNILLYETFLNLELKNNECKTIKELVTNSRLSLGVPLRYLYKNIMYDENYTLETYFQIKLSD